MFEKNTKKNADGQVTNVICNSAKQGLIPQREYFDKDIANSDNTNGYYIIADNDFVYNPRKSSDAPYGPISRYKYSEDGIVSPLYLCFRAKKEINPAFFEWYFRSSAWHRYIYMSGDSGARHDRVSIKDDIFFSMPINIPATQEQAHIASFLEKIDLKIAKQRALVDALKKYKRGVSVAIFDRNLSLVKNSPSWIETTVGAICKLTMGQSPNSDSYNTNQLGVPLVQGNADMTNRKTCPQRYTSKPTKLCKEGSVILSVRAPVGSVGRADRTVCLGRGVCAINSDNNDFMYYFFERNEPYWKCIEQGGTFTAISSEDIANMYIEYPSLEERQVIVNFLLKIDNHIKLEENTLNQLIELKSGLLKQLFI